MTKQDKIAILLAYINRYTLPILAVLIPLIVMPADYIVCGVGGCVMLYGVYSYVGYRLRWKHIYLSFQKGRGEQMTPKQIRWENMPHAAALTGLAVSIVLGIVVILVGLPK